MSRLVLQPSFSRGEIAPSLHGRVDLSLYGTGLKRCENFIVRPYGGVSNRPGLRYCGDALDDAATQMVPFIVRRGLAYLIELGHERARFWFEGALLVAGDPLEPVEIVTPYAAVDLAAIRFTQSADALFMVHPDYPPQILRRTGATTFTIEELETVDGPFRDINPNEAIRVASSRTEGVTTITANADIFTSGMVGHLIYLEAEKLGQIKPWTVGDRSVTVGALRRSDGKTYRARTVPSATDWTECGPVRPIHEQGAEWDGPGDLRTNGTQSWRVGVEWEYVDSGFGVAKILTVPNATSVTALVLRRMPTGVIGGLGSATATWNLTGDGVATGFDITGAVALSRNQYTVTFDGVLVPPSPVYIPPGSGGGLPGDPGNPFPPGFIEE